MPLYTIDFGIIFRTGLCGFFLMFYKNYTHVWASQVALVVKNLPASAGDRRDVGSIPESGRSPEEGMKTHPSVLPWRVPWTEEPGGLQSIGSQRVRHNLTEHTHLEFEI